MTRQEAYEVLGLQPGRVGDGNPRRAPPPDARRSSGCRRVGLARQPDQPGARHFAWLSFRVRYWHVAVSCRACHRIVAVIFTALATFPPIPHGALQRNFIPELTVIKKLRKAVLPVAGLGTRFLPATKATAKEMLPVVDKPLIQYAVEEARAAGIEQFCMVTGRGKTALVEHFDVAFELEATLRERHEDRGAGGAARHAKRAGIDPHRAPAGAAGAGPRHLVRPRVHRRRSVRHPAARRSGAGRQALPARSWPTPITKPAATSSRWSKCRTSRPTATAS